MLLKHKLMLIIFILIMLSVGCSQFKKNINSPLWNKYLKQDIKMNKIQPNKVMVKYKRIIKEKETFYLINYKYDGNKFIFTDGTLNNQNLYSNHPSVNTISNILNDSNNRKSIFSDIKVNYKVEESNKYKCIENKKCKQFNFINTVTNNDNKKYIEIGKCWIDVNSAKIYEVKYKHKLLVLIPIKSNVTVLYKYDNNENLLNIENQTIFEINMPFNRSRNEFIFVYSDFIK